MGNQCIGKDIPEEQEPRKLHEKELQMLLDNTSYTQEEIIEWHKGFIKDNPEAKMNKKQFARAYKRFYPASKPEGYIDHVFRVFDADSNGFIDFQEFLVAISITSTNRNLKRKLKWIFTMYDIDGNGSIDKKEFRTIVMSIFKILDTKNQQKSEKEREEHIDVLFQKIDRDHSNLISLDEFIDACTRDKLLLELLAPTT